jgi:hypothetical protein
LPCQVGGRFEIVTFVWYGVAADAEPTMSMPATTSEPTTMIN